VVLAASRKKVLNQLQLVSFTHIYEPTFDVCAWESQNLLDKFALTFGSTCYTHAQDVGIKLYGGLDILNHESGMEKRFQHYFNSCFIQLLI